MTSSGSHLREPVAAQALEQLGSEPQAAKALALEANPQWVMLWDGWSV